MNVLITGGGGFLGTHLARALLADGQAVTLYDLDFPAQWNGHAGGPPPGLALETGDIRDGSRLTAVLKRQRITHLVHLATLLTEACEADPARGIDVNCRGSAVVFETAGRLGLERVLYGSSVAVFSAAPDQGWGDDRPYGPSSVYGLTKVFVEQLAQQLAPRYPGTIYHGLRFGWIYGPGRDRGWRTVQAVIEQFANGDRRITYPDYQGPLDWTYIEDAVEAVRCTLAAPRPGVPAYNVSGDCRTIQQAVKHLQTIFPDVHAEPYPAALPPVGWQFENDHIASETGFVPRYGLEAGLDRFLALLRAEQNT